MSIEALEDSLKAGRRMRSSASWTMSLADMEDMSKVRDHLLPICWQPETDTIKDTFRIIPQGKAMTYLTIDMQTIKGE